MRLSQTFQPAPDGAGEVAKFGRTAVTIRPRTGTVDIYRDGVRAGEWPQSGYSVQVHGELSASAASLEGARALGEHYARQSEANHHTGARGRPRYAMTPEAARAEVEAMQADSAGLMAAFPFTAQESARLAASRHHADVLEPLSAEEFARRAALFC